MSAAAAISSTVVAAKPLWANSRSASVWIIRRVRSLRRSRSEAGGWSLGGRVVSMTSLYVKLPSIDILALTDITWRGAPTKGSGDGRRGTAGQDRAAGRGA